MMRTFLFTDLDDTLFQTLRKCAVPPECTPHMAEAHGLHAAAWSREGQPLSFMTRRQRALLALLDKALIIPVTARDREAYERVRLPLGEHGAVLNYGGTVLLPGGQEDVHWQKLARESLMPWQRPLEALAAQLTAWAEGAGLAVRIRIIAAEGCAFYVVVKNAQRGPCVLAQVREAGIALLDKPLLWRIHHNGNNLAFIPAALNKAHAVRYVLDTYIAPLGEDFLTIGMGDSLVDWDFMRLCDYAVMPSGSQIQKVGMDGEGFFGQL